MPINAPHLPLDVFDAGLGCRLALTPPEATMIGPIEAGQTQIWPHKQYENSGGWQAARTRRPQRALSVQQ